MSKGYVPPLSGFSHQPIDSRGAPLVMPPYQQFLYPPLPGHEDQPPPLHAHQDPFAAPQTALSHRSLPVYPKHPSGFPHSQNIRSWPAQHLRNFPDLSEYTKTCFPASLMPPNYRSDYFPIPEYNYAADRASAAAWPYVSLSGMTGEPGRKAQSEKRRIEKLQDDPQEKAQEAQEKSMVPQEKPQVQKQIPQCPCQECLLSRETYYQVDSTQLHKEFEYLEISDTPLHVSGDTDQEESELGGETCSDEDSDEDSDESDESDDGSIFGVFDPEESFYKVMKLSSELEDARKRVSSLEQQMLRAVGSSLWEYQAALKEIRGRSRKPTRTSSEINKKKL